MADEMNLPKGDLMRGKRGVVMGVANHNSIAYAIAAQLAAQGAQMAWTYIDAMERRVKPLGEPLGVKTFVPCEVTDDASMDSAFAAVKDAFGTIDFLVHAIAFSDKNELKGSFVENTTKANFLKSMEISAWSFVDASRRAAELMPNGGSLITLTYLGSERVIPNYNVMGVAKAALEASTPLHRPRPRPQGHPLQRDQRGRHPHPVAGGHLRRPLDDRPGPRLVAPARGHRARGGCGLRPVAAQRPRPLDHGRGGACGRRFPHRRPARRAFHARVRHRA